MRERAAVPASNAATDTRRGPVVRPTGRGSECEAVALSGHPNSPDHPLEWRRAAESPQPGRKGGAAPGHRRGRRDQRPSAGEGSDPTAASRGVDLVADGRAPDEHGVDPPGAGARGVAAGRAHRLDPTGTNPAHAGCASGRLLGRTSRRWWTPVRPGRGRDHVRSRPQCPLRDHWARTRRRHRVHPGGRPSAAGRRE